MKRKKPTTLRSAELWDAEEAAIAPGPVDYSSGSGSEGGETAAERRVRLAKDYLSTFAKDDENDEESSSSEGEDGVVRGGEDRVARKLRKERLRQQGLHQREVAQKLGGIKATDGMVKRCGSHDLSVTSVALSADDTAAFSGSKDSSLYRWDVETGAKIELAPSWRKLKRLGADPGRSETGQILALATSSDGRYLASGGRDKLVKVWDCRTNKTIESFTGHRDAVSSLAFRPNSLDLFSGSHDRSVRLWTLNQMGYVETLFGHQSDVNCMDASQKGQLVTGGRDRTVRIWKIQEESHLVYRQSWGGSIDCAKFLNNEWFVSSGESGHLDLWFNMKKKAAASAEAHGGAWICSLATLKMSDLAVSGSSDGFVRFWHCDTAERSLNEVVSIPLSGYVNGLAMSSTGKFVLAGVGQEHRLGRWSREKKAKNSVYVISLPD